ncbi:MAG: TIGR03619 family F420-dependent LLM class oxidoreductase [Deltaproteobacteria bacterium]|nr:TIGR03619 family F420-dependent LLM class oxidoreductase [Deltaproteobacteria bacterium]
MRIGLAVEGIRPAAAAGDLAARVEALGYSSLFAPDHLAFTNPILDPFEVLACYATRTRTLRLGTGVLLLALRHPALVAKQAASLDYLCGGRFVLGIGVGGEFASDFAVVEVPVGERGSRTDEAIPVLRALWRGEPPPAGRRFRVPQTDLAPRPVQPGGPPIWVGGRAAPALRRAALLGDGYVGFLLDPPGVAERLATIRRIRAAQGDEAARARPLAAAVMCFALADESRERALERAGPWLSRMYRRPMESAAARFGILGSPEECREAARRYRAAGVEELVLSPLAHGDDLVPLVEALASALL